MLKFACLLALCFTAVVGLPSQQRIAGGSVTNINQYRFAAAMLGKINQNFVQQCGGTIINNRSVLSAAHCFPSRTASNHRVRVGSTNANSGGTVYAVSQIINHPNYNTHIQHNDISVVRVSGSISFGGSVQPGRIAGSGYNLGDNQAVWVIGWGLTSEGGSSSEQLRHVQIRTLSSNTCRSLYGVFTDNMVCAGDMNSGRGTCSRDSGGPLIHNGAVVGVVSFGAGCGRPRSPSVFTKVSKYTSWIQSNG